jgi:acetyl esterase
VIKRNLAVSLSFTIAAALAASTEPSGYKVEENIEFKQQPVSLHLDAHIPRGKGPFPAVILVHGGGWTGGSKTANFILPLFEPLTKIGYTWFTIDYRLALQHPYPAAPEDVESAIVFVKNHAKT